MRCWSALPKRPALMTALLVGLCWPALAQAQDFINLDFEMAHVDEGTIFQRWEDAIPGWQHSDGADTEIVYWGLSHVGVTQMYRLYGADQANTPWGFPFQGQYGVFLRSGFSSTFDEDAYWVNAFLAQTGTVPVGTRSLHLQADGPLSVTLNGTGLTLIDLGGHHLAADITAFAGQTVNLRITDGTTGLAPGLFLDGLSLSTTAVVPEPSSSVLALLGLAVALPWLRHRRQAL